MTTSEVIDMTFMGTLEADDDPEMDVKVWVCQETFDLVFEQSFSDVNEEHKDQIQFDKRQLSQLSTLLHEYFMDLIQISPVMSQN